MMTRSSKRSADSAPFTGGGSVPRSGRAAGSTEESAARPETGPAEETVRPRRSGSLWFRPSVTNTKLIYAGFLMSLALPFIAIISAIFAHQSAKEDPPAWLASHYLYQIRTFWIGFFANVVAWGLSFVGVGLLLFPLIALWVVARSVKGLIRIAQRAEIEEPLSYFV